MDPHRCTALDSPRLAALGLSRRASLVIADARSRPSGAGVGSTASRPGPLALGTPGRRRLAQGADAAGATWH